MIAELLWGIIRGDNNNIINDNKQPIILSVNNTFMI
jgi:hypothetical protein